MNAPTESDEVTTRPRVEGEREREVLAAALGVLADVGYDRLTMDAVATAARASKATLYRRWQSKAALVVDAVAAQKPAPVEADTGTLRGDLLATFCGLGGLTDTHQVSVMGALITAITRDQEFAAAFRERFVGPRHAAARTIFERARERGEIPAEVDLDVLTVTLPGIVLHRIFVLGEPPGPDLVTSVVDQVVLPAALRRSPDPAPPVREALS